MAIVLGSDIKNIHAVFGISQQGGSVASHIKISKDTLYSSVTLNGQADVVLEMGNPTLTNIILLGALVGANILPIEKEDMMPILEERFPGKILETNIKAFEKGMEMIAAA